VFDAEDLVRPDGGRRPEGEEVILLPGDVLREGVGHLGDVVQLVEHPELDRLGQPLDRQAEGVEKVVIHASPRPAILAYRSCVNRAPMRGTSRRAAILVAVAAAVLFFLAGTWRDFWAPDEPDFAEQTREMLERRDLLIPYQNGVPYSEKPPLFYWAIAATTLLSGGDVHPAATRLPSALAAGAIVFAAAWLAGRRGSRSEALLAGAVTATAPVVWWQGQFLQIDALFSALVVWGYIAEWGVWNDPERATRWRWALHLLIPAGILAKGPLTLILLGLVAAVECGRVRSLRPVLDLGPARGAAVALLLVVPWYAAAALQGGRAYAYDLIVNQNWNRFWHAFDHIQPWWFYVESVFIDFEPWTLPALAAPFLVARAGLFRERSELRLSAMVFATAFVFLSVSQSKQGKYLLMAYPFAAVLLAAAVGSAGPERRSSGSPLWIRLFRGYAAVAGVGLFVAAVLLPIRAASRFPAYAGIAPWVAVPLGLGGLGVVAVALARRREAVPVLLALAAAVAAGEASVAAAVFPAVDGRKTGRAFYERIAPRFAHGEPLAYYGDPYRCYPILVLRRKTAHPTNEEQLSAWLRAEPQGKVLVTEDHLGEWKDPLLRSLVVVDRSPVGQGDVLLMGLP
jgi:4-amino-4-deoxy-L-arabinose transferase-like glycosyltransferase